MKKIIFSSEKEIKEYSSDELNLFSK